MATKAVERTSLSGLLPTFSACDAAGDEFVNDGKTLVIIRNDDASPHTVTIVNERLSNTGKDDDEGGVVAAGTWRVFGPFNRGRFNAGTTGRVKVTLDDDTNMFIAVVGLGDTLPQ